MLLGCAVWIWWPWPYLHVYTHVVVFVLGCANCQLPHHQDVFTAFSSSGGGGGVQLITGDLPVFLKQLPETVHLLLYLPRRSWNNDKCVVCMQKIVHLWEFGKHTLGSTLCTSSAVHNENNVGESGSPCFILDCGAKTVGMIWLPTTI